MASSGLASDREAPSLRALYDSALGPYLAAQDARVLAARRNRWLVLVAGLALAGGLLAWVLRRHTDSEIGPMIAFAVAVGAVGFFWLSTASLADDVRHELMSRIAAWLRLRYEAAATGFDLERFALLGLAGCDKIRRSDRLSGKAGGLGVDMMAVRLADETSTGIGSERQTRTIERFTGLLMRLGDPMPPGVRFRLVPTAQAAARNMLRDVTIVTHTHSTSRSMPPTAGLPAMQVTEPEAAPVTLTGDTAFDARFELHALGPDVPRLWFGSMPVRARHCSTSRDASAAVRSRSASTEARYCLPSSPTSGSRSGRCVRRWHSSSAYSILPIRWASST